MIVQFNYEELRALKAGASAFLGEIGQEASPVLAPPEQRAHVEALLPLLHGDLSLSTLAEVRTVQVGVEAIVACLRAEMESAVLAAYPADEIAVAAYFDFAHALTVSYRLEMTAAEMTALIELMTGAAPTAETARDLHFPD